MVRGAGGRHRKLIQRRRRVPVDHAGICGPAGVPDHHRGVGGDALQVRRAREGLREGDEPGAENPVSGNSQVGEGWR